MVVRLNWLDQLSHILAVPSGTDPKKTDAEGTAFDPPPGSRAAKLDKLKREHPALYAARHVVIAIGQVLIGVLGIGALLQALLPRIGLPDIPWPNVPLPDIALPELGFLDQLKELWSSVNWLVPIVIAVVFAINEVSKRRKREQAAAARRRTESVSR